MPGPAFSRFAIILLVGVFAACPPEDELTPWPTGWPLLLENSSQKDAGASLFKSAPVGAIIAWHKNFPLTPELPEEWLECNGQTVTDSESVYFDQALPDLNADISGDGGFFLRGSPSSGDFQDHQLQYHEHFIASGPSENGGWGANGFPRGSRMHTGGVSSGNAGNETRPVNMSVVWIMKIK